MADDIKFDADKEFDELDNLFNESGFDDNTEDLPKGDRSPVDSVLKDTKTVLKDKLSADNAFSVLDRVATKAMPDKMASEATNLLNIKDEIVNENKDAINNLRNDTSSVLGKLASGMDENSFIGKSLNKLTNLIKTDDESSDKGPSEDEEIANSVSSLLSSIGDKESKKEEERALQESLRGKTQEELLAKMTAGITTGNNYQIDVMDKYFRKSLELDYKRTYLMDKLFNLSKTTADTTGKQLEGILRNTSMPDIVKTKSAEYLKHLGRDKLMKSGISAISNNSLFSNLKNTINDKVTDTISGLSGGVGAIGMMQDTSEMLGDMGITPLQMALSSLIDSGTNTVSDKAGKGILDFALKTKYGKDAALMGNKITSDYSLGAQDLINKIEDGKDSDSFINKRLIDALNLVVDSKDSKHIQDYSLMSDDPDEVTIFDNKAKKSITTVIPTLLSKINNQLIGIRTGKVPDSEDVYDYYSNTFTNTKQIKNDLIKSNIESAKELRENLGNSDIFTVFESAGKLTQGERKKVKLALHKFIANGGTTSIYYLIQDGFLDELSGSVKTKVEKSIKNIANDSSIQAQTKAKNFQKALDILRNSIGENASNIQQSVNKVNMLGRTDVLSDLGYIKNNDGRTFTGSTVTSVTDKVLNKAVDGKVSSNNLNLTDSEYTTAMKIRKDIIAAVQKINIKEIDGINKADVIAKIKKLNLKQFLDLGEVTKNITTLRSFVKDLGSGKIKMLTDKEIEAKNDETMFSKYAPKTVKNAFNSVTNTVNDKLNPLKKNLNKLAKDKLGYEDAEDIANVDWNKNDLSSNLNHDVKISDSVLDSKKKNVETVGITIVDKFDILNNTVSKIFDLLNKDNVKEEKKEEKPHVKKGYRRRPKIVEGTIDEILREGVDKGKLKGFSDGEYTGDGDKKEIAGVVHKNEYVINAKKLSKLVNTVSGVLKEKVTKENAYDKTTELLNKMNNGISNVKSGIDDFVKKENINKETVFNKINTFKNNNLQQTKDYITNESLNISKRLEDTYNKLFDNRDGIITSAFDNKNPNSITNKITSAFDINNPNSVTSKINNAFDNKNPDSIINKFTTLLNKENINNIYTDSKEYVNEKYNTFKEKNKDKLQIPEVMKNFKSSTVFNTIEEHLETPSKAASDLKKNMEEQYNAIKDKGLFTYLKEVLSTEPLPEEEEAEPYYTRVVNTIDPKGKLLQLLSKGGKFLKTMFTLHMSGIAMAGKGMLEAGKFVAKKATDGVGGVSNYVKNLLPPQLRHMLDNTTSGRLAKKLGITGKNMVSTLGGILKDNLKVIKDTAKESFTDKDGNIKVNLLRAGKFIGKTGFRTIKTTARGADGKGGIRKLYGDMGKGALGVAKESGSLFLSFLGITKNIPFYKRDKIVEEAPISEDIKAMYFNGEISWDDIPKKLNKKERNNYLKYLKKYKTTINLASGVNKLAKGYVKSAGYVGSKVVRPGTDSLVDKIKGIKGLSSIKSILGIDELFPSKKKDTKTKFDTDGDGIRDGSYIERLKNMGKSKNSAKDDKHLKDTAKKAKKEGGLLSTLLQFAPFIIAGVGGIFTKAIGGVTSLLSGIGSAITGLGSSLLKGISGLGTGIMKTVSSIIPKGVKGFVNTVVDKGKTLASSIGKGISKITPNAVKTLLSSMKTTIVKKLGMRAGGKLIAKLASRLVPVVGWSLLVYDAAKISYLMYSKHMSFKKATSIQILGFDIFDKNEAPIDPDTKEPIKPDMPEDRKDDKISTLSTKDINTPVNNIKYDGNSVLAKVLNKDTVKTSLDVEKDKKDLIKKGKLTKDGKLAPDKFKESVVVAKAISKSVKGLNNETLLNVQTEHLSNTNDILAKSLNVQKDMADTLNGIYELNKIIAEKLTNKEITDEEVYKNQAPAITENALRKAFTLNASSF